MLLTFSLTLSLFSCTTPPETLSGSSDDTEETREIKYSDESDYDYLIVLLNNSMMHKLYPEEGIVVPLCPDPLCKHNSQSCPFFQASPSICKRGNIIYYLRKGNSQAYYLDICKFDLDSGKYEVLYGANGFTISGLYATEDYLFFKAMSVRPNEGTGYKVMRYDIKTKEVVELMTEYVVGDLTLLNHDAERLYWSESRIYYSTDYDYKNKKENDRGFHANMSTGDYSFSIDFPDAVSNLRQITSFNRKTGEEKVIVESTRGLLIAYKGKVIYTLPDEVVFIGNKISGSSEKTVGVYDKYGGKLYISNADGSDAKLLCDLTGNNCALDMGPTTVGGCDGVGDYIVWPLWYYETVDEENNIVKRRPFTGRFDFPDKFAVINYKTGEYKIIDTVE
ncbi:MAG: hypothetical protein E7665_08195 [Ruminococcaceae bacterium]|nr:hypothetical protein [Oscillospiraceae bacterium]